MNIHNKTEKPRIRGRRREERKKMKRLVIEETSVYELDESCLKRKSGSKERKEEEEGEERENRAGSDEYSFRHRQLFLKKVN